MNIDTRFYYTYIMTNNTRDQFITGHTEDIVKIVTQFHQTDFRRNYLPPEKQDCFLLVFVQRFDHPSRALLVHDILTQLTDQAIKIKIATFNPHWKSLNLDVLHSETGWLSADVQSQP